MTATSGDSHSCRDCRGKGGTLTHPCGRCGAHLEYTRNIGALAWLLRRYGDATHNRMYPSADQWDMAFWLDEAGVTAPTSEDPSS